MSEEFYQPRAVSLQKTPRFASPRYLIWIRDQPCANCLAPPPSDPHHIKGIGKYSGVGLRASDSTAMPLCRTCHSRLHGGVIPMDKQWQWLAQTASRALVEIAEGRLKI